MVTVERGEGRGRPRKAISEEFLREAFRPERNISIPNLASALGVHVSTVKRYMHQYGIKRQPFSTISDSSLDAVIKEYKAVHPNTGIRYIRGHLSHQGMRVQRDRIVASLSRVDSVAKVISQRKVIERREYESSRPNALWHVDGHHKLGPWGIVIHGFVDGYDRMVHWYYALTIVAVLTPPHTRSPAYVCQHAIQHRLSSNSSSTPSRSLGVHIV